MRIQGSHREKGKILSGVGWMMSSVFERLNLPIKKGAGVREQLTRV